MNLNTRIQKIIDYSELTASEFADEIGVQRSSISHITSGRNKPSLDFISKIKSRFPEIQWEWILEGKGSMTTPSLPTPTPPEVQGSKINIDEGEELHHFSNLFSDIEPSSQDTATENENFSNPREFNILIQSKEREEISDSQRLEIKEEKPIIKSTDNQENKIKKIVFFYENGKFEAFEP